MWNQDFPILVVSPPDALVDVEDMAQEINEDVGRELFIVRMRRAYETIDRPDDDVVVYLRVSKGAEPLCDKKDYLGYTNFWFKYGKYYSTLMICDHRITDSMLRRNVIKHELLHSLGFDHTDVRGYILYPSVPGNLQDRTISDRDIKILREL